MLMKISKTDTRDTPASRRHAHTAKQCEPMPNAINCGRYVNVAHVRHTFGVGVFLTRPISVVGVRARPPEEKLLYTRAVCARWAFFGVYFARDWEICVRTPNASFTPHCLSGHARFLRTRFLPTEYCRLRSSASHRRHTQHRRGLPARPCVKTYTDTQEQQQKTHIHTHMHI